MDMTWWRINQVDLSIPIWSWILHRRYYGVQREVKATASGDQSIETVFVECSHLTLQLDECETEDSRGLMDHYRGSSGMRCRAVD
jgi:hypothetical protein